MAKPVILAVRGCDLGVEEREFIRKTQPFGFLLFARNLRDHKQIPRLNQQLRALVDHPVMIMIDQEGGRVSRLKAPLWPEFPAARNYGALYRHDAALGAEFAKLGGELIASNLASLGFDINAVPVLDVDFQSPSDVIGDRAFGRDVATIIACANAFISGTMACNILPIIKHIPGHGRALLDSHKSLPIVDASLDELAACDFVPFVHFCAQPMAMVAHIVYNQIDPELPATLSRKIIDGIIKTHIGFHNLLLSDDIAMGALSGSFAARATDAMAAGIDVILVGDAINDDVVDMCNAMPAADANLAKRWFGLANGPRTQLVDWDEKYHRFCELHDLAKPLCVNAR